MPLVKTGGSGRFFEYFVVPEWFDVVDAVIDVSRLMVGASVLGTGSIIVSAAI